MSEALIPDASGNKADVQKDLLHRIYLVRRPTCTRCHSQSCGRREDFSISWQLVGTYVSRKKASTQPYPLHSPPC